MEQYEKLIDRAEVIGQQLITWADQGRFDGKDGHYDITEVPANQYIFNVDSTDGHLYIYYADKTTPPPFELGADGHLYYVVED